MSFSLCLAAQRARHLPVRLVVMSATFGSLGERVKDLLGNPEVINSQGRSFPVEVFYRGLVNLRKWEPSGPMKFAETVAKTIKMAMENHPGDCLVFLPGEREIMYTWIALNNMGIGDGVRPKNLVEWADRKVDLSKNVQVATLYGNMEQREQDEVLQAGLGKTVFKQLVVGHFLIKIGCLNMFKHCFAQPWLQAPGLLLLLLLLLLLVLL
ncbi:unnamed protein product [Polarella glacialis]|uniref:Uncharacterized protein n=1 Tax=Polarella glacialis TaxID=89957 RepID=A0A813FK12_POLGL|nr:unnamed protein product [Polarella glacialis]